MSKKPTQEDRVAAALKRDGYISNLDAINNYHILRLASVISKLRQNGWLIDTDFKGVVGNKNCVYKLVGSPSPRSNYEPPTIIQPNEA